MRILWVEDLGGISPDQLFVMLKGWIDDNKRDALASALEDNMRNQNPKFWMDYYKENLLPNASEVHFCIQLSDLKEKLKTRKTINFFDVILIDINLESNLFGEESDWPQGIEPQRAGLWVYNRLVRLGFPPQRLAFITGNAVDAAKNFVENCRSNFIEPEPKAFEKGEKNASVIDETNNETVADWLVKIEKQNDKFLLLRRGIIDGCDYICEQLDSRGIEIIQFNQFCKDGSEAIHSVDSAKEYLNLVANSLPAEIYADNTIELALRPILRTIAHEWESEVHPNNLPSHFRKNITLSALGYVMKNTRNLMSHSRELHNVSCEDIAFLFLVNCRAMFLLDETLAPYEKILLQLHEKVTINKKKLENDLLETRRILKEKFMKYFGKSSRDGKTITYTPHYNMWVQIIGFNSSKLNELNYIEELYRVFYHSIHPWKENKGFGQFYQYKSPISDFLEAFYFKAFKSTDLN